MNADILDTLRAADPAQDMPETEADDREQLRRAIVATPVDPRRRPRRERTRRRLVTVVAVGGALIILCGGAVYATTVMLPAIPESPVPVFRTYEQVRGDYYAWTKKIPLPPGVKWPKFGMRRRNSTYGEAQGAIDAQQIATGLWARECIAAIKAGNAQRAATAIDWLANFRDNMPNHKGLSENQAGYNQNDIDSLSTAIAAAKEGKYEGKLDSLSYFAEWADPWGGKKPEPEPYPSPKYFINWTGTSNHPQTNANSLISADAARAEYQALLANVGLPPGVHPQDYPGPDSQGQNYGLGDSSITAYEYAWTAWWHEWVAAAKAGDQARIAAAVTASDRLREILPLKASQSGLEVSNTLGTDSLHDFERLEAQALTGDMRGIEAWLAFQKVYRERIREAGPN